MKIKHLIGVLWILIGSCSLISCDKPTPDAPLFLFDENGVCYSPSAVPISKATFTETVLNSGWKHVHTYQINPNGYLSPKDYYEGLLGCGPAYFYFKNESTVTKYFFADAIPAAGFYTSTYQFNDKNHLLATCGIDMQILSLHKNEIKVIEFLGVYASGEKIYGYATYRRMTDSELAQVQQQYTTDFTNPARPGLNQL